MIKAGCAPTVSAFWHGGCCRCLPVQQTLGRGGRGGASCEPQLQEPEQHLLPELCVCAALLSVASVACFQQPAIRHGLCPGKRLQAPTPMLRANPCIILAPLCRAAIEYGTRWASEWPIGKLRPCTIANRADAGRQAGSCQGRALLGSARPAPSSSILLPHIVTLVQSCAAARRLAHACINLLAGTFFMPDPLTQPCPAAKPAATKANATAKGAAAAAQGPVPSAPLSAGSANASSTVGTAAPVTSTASATDAAAGNAMGRGAAGGGDAAAAGVATGSTAASIASGVAAGSAVGGGSAATDGAGGAAAGSSSGGGAASTAARSSTISSGAADPTAGTGNVASLGAATGTGTGSTPGVAAGAPISPNAVTGAGSSESGGTTPQQTTQQEQQSAPAALLKDGGSAAIKVQPLLDAGAEVVDVHQLLKKPASTAQA